MYMAVPLSRVIAGGRDELDGVRSTLAHKVHVEVHVDMGEWTISTLSSLIVYGLMSIH